MPTSDQSLAFIKAHAAYPMHGSEYEERMKQVIEITEWAVRLKPTAGADFTLFMIDFLKSMARQSGVKLNVAIDKSSPN